MDETRQRNGEVLNWLLQGANDSAQGFRQGADLARNPKLKALFSERAQQREQLAGQIAEEVRSFEQPPTESGTVIGEAHRAFTYLRDAISKDSDKGLVEELLRREQALSDKFQSAINDTRLPPEARSVATAALPGFAATTDELGRIDQEFAGDPSDGSGGAGRFKLSEDDTTFLAVPAGSVVLASGADGTDGRLERTRDAVVRIGIQAVAVATSQGGSLSVAIEAGGGSSNGRDGPGPIEQRLMASLTLEVTVKAGVAVPFKTSATPENAQLLRTVVWSLDVGDTAQTTTDPAPIASAEAERPAASEDLDRPIA